MDERQAQIRERAGLEESRLNKEFIDWLQRRGSTLLIIALLAFLAYRGYEWYVQKKHEKADTAFTEYESARAGGNVSPLTMLDIAQTYSGVGSVAILARLDAADAYLNSARVGVKPGAVFNDDGTLKNADDQLTDADRADALNNAFEQYQLVLNGTQGVRGKEMLAVGALSGLASVEESRGEIEKAKGYYQRIIDLTKDASLKPHAAVAQKRIDSLNDLKEPVSLPTQAQLPELPQDLQQKLNPTPPSMPPGITPVPPPTAPVEPTTTPGEQPQPAPADPAGPKPGDPATTPSEPKPEEPKPATPEPTPAPK